MPRSYQVTPGILGRRRATQPKKVRPTADSMEKGQPAADREPSRPDRTPPPDAPRLSLTWKAAARLAHPLVVSRAIGPLPNRSTRLLTIAEKPSVRSVLLPSLACSDSTQDNSKERHAHEHQLRQRHEAAGAEDVETVLAGLAGGGYVKVSCSHHLHKTPSGSAWVNAALGEVRQPAALSDSTGGQDHPPGSPASRLLFGDGIGRRVLGPVSDSAILDASPPGPSPDR